MTFEHEHVVKFYTELYTSERRALAEWLGVPREPAESDVEFGKRILLTANAAGKVDELADRIERYVASHPPR